MSVEILETQTSRENKLIALATALFPDLQLTSRRHYGEFRSNLPRLRFDKPKPRAAFWTRLFGSPADPTKPAITITGPAQQSLNLDGGWTDISIHVFEADLLQKATQLATSISAATAKSVNVIREE